MIRIYNEPDYVLQFIVYTIGVHTFHVLINSYLKYSSVTIDVPIRACVFLHFSDFYYFSCYDYVFNLPKMNTKYLPIIYKLPIRVFNI